MRVSPRGRGRQVGKLNAGSIMTAGTVGSVPPCLASPKAAGNLRVSRDGRYDN
jgi:hypothetical protein